MPTRSPDPAHPLGAAGAPGWLVDAFAVRGAGITHRVVTRGVVFTDGVTLTARVHPMTGAAQAHGQVMAAHRLAEVGIPAPRAWGWNREPTGPGALCPVSWWIPTPAHPGVEPLAMLTHLYRWHTEDPVDGLPTHDPGLHTGVALSASAAELGAAMTGVADSCPGRARPPDRAHRGIVCAGFVASLRAPCTR